MKFNTLATQVSNPVNLQPQRRPLVVFCLPGKDFTPGFFDSWTRFLLQSKSLPFDIVVSRHYSPVIFHCRANLLGADNRAGKHQMPFQGKLDYDYIMWLDSDIIFDVPQIMQLYTKMQQDKSIEVLSGIYLTTSGTHSTIVKNWDTSYFLKTGMFPFMTPAELKADANANPKKLAEVFYAGMGCMMCRRGAIEKVTYPWFEPIMHEVEFSKDFSSEDVSLCWKWREAGVKIYVDPDIIMGHEKSAVIR